MKLIHLSDLHIGKRLNEISLIEDQVYIFSEILKIIDEENPNAVLICGDVYDKSDPSLEAIKVFDEFLVNLTNRKLNVFVISGNHDSAVKIAQYSRILSSSNVFMSQVYNGNITPIKLSDEFGEINFYMLPFIKPVHVRECFNEEKIESYNDAVLLAVKNMNIDSSRRNVILTHQFVTGAEISESEEHSVGGSDNISAEIFKDFDYVALGHIHKSQGITRQTLRYCGTPLKYSFSEVKHKKTLTVVEMLEKNNTIIREIPLVPIRDMQEIKGSYIELTSPRFYANLNLDDYYSIILTDEDNVPFAMDKLRIIYKNLMKISYDNARTRNSGAEILIKNTETKTPLELLSEFYESQNKSPMTSEQVKYLSQLIESTWGGNNASH